MGKINLSGLNFMANMKARFVERQDEVLFHLAKLYEIFVYIVEKRTVEVIQ
jgi:hypothetical protein